MGEEATRGEDNVTFREGEGVWWCRETRLGAGGSYLHRVLLEEAERVGKHLQCLHLLPIDSF